MTKKFQRKIEDFKCENCGREVVGDGYTNHCPECLWSKHVDKNPGDREERCSGMMKPVGGVKKKGEFYLTHQCQKCGFERMKKMEKEDNFEALISISKKTGGEENP